MAMTKRRRRAKPVVRMEPRPPDYGHYQAWAKDYGTTDPTVVVEMDRGTFLFVWDWVDRYHNNNRGYKANFHPNLVRVMDSANEAFQYAARQAFGDAYDTPVDASRAHMNPRMVHPQHREEAGVEQDGPQTASEVSGETPAAPVRRRRRKVTPATTEAPERPQRRRKKP